MGRLTTKFPSHAMLDSPTGAAAGWFPDGKGSVWGQSGVELGQYVLRGWQVTVIVFLLSSAMVQVIVPVPVNSRVPSRKLCPSRILHIGRFFPMLPAGVEYS